MKLATDEIDKQALSAISHPLKKSAGKSWRAVYVS
jgi:hypothetical protein